MTTTALRIEFFTRDGSIIFNQAVECTSCHTMHFFFKNLYGSTACLDCKAMEREAWR